ncbi:uncharacterized protein EV422DRAFT_510535, partial [Fimicolochytrium jonesii]|uniref:uncharacterized protein n=1 Tax=Fimicolochytrium jonesii TaxID=1396493 RepID=UPI0022FECB51
SCVTPSDGRNVPDLILHGKEGPVVSAVTREQLCKLLRWKAGIYKILVPDHVRKLYFDVDKAETPLSEIKRVILGEFQNARLQISGREGSWHIILSNYYAQNLEAMGPVVRFVHQYKELGFDTHVYTKNRNFKCINQAKPNQPRQAYIEGDAEWSKHLNSPRNGETAPLPPS